MVLIFDQLFSVNIVIFVIIGTQYGQAEVVLQMCPMKNLSWKISPNSQENTNARTLFIKISGQELVTSLKERLQRRYFSVNFLKYPKTAIFVEQLQAKTPSQRYFVFNICQQSFRFFPTNILTSVQPCFQVDKKLRHRTTSNQL